MSKFLRHMSAVIILASVTPGSAQVIYVKAGATGSGASWSDPEGSLQNAVNSVGAGGQVWVAQGTYTPGPNQSDTFTLVDQVLVVGGYFGTPGTELNANARDPNPTNTVLSGEIGTPGFGDNIITIVSGPIGLPFLTNDAILDGFTITGADRHAIDLIGNNSPTLSNLNIVGNGDASALLSTDFAGAGLTMIGGSRPIIESCTFSANVATAGGAVDIPGGRPLFTNCRFEANSASGPAVGFPFLVGGGAVRIGSVEAALDPALGISVPTTFRNCTFDQNDALGGSGGAILKTGALHLVHCAFTGNTAAGAGHDGNGPVHLSVGVSVGAGESSRRIVMGKDFGDHSSKRNRMHGRRDVLEDSKSDRH